MKEIEKTNVTEALLFSHRVAQLSKALWKSVEKDWQAWLKPFQLNINEHHILWVTYHLDGASISEIANFGVMHVSTAFNFSKKLENRGYLSFSKKENDKRNTYIQLTEQGASLFEETMHAFNPNEFAIYTGAEPLRNVYGKHPELIEIVSIVREIYGDDFMRIFEASLQTHHLNRSTPATVT
ncbi:HTH-type transcriptional regulator Hpr [Bacillaceae bacterium SIJ1]|uniref:HTH-type transcriptional regulator Hpr n=1 Tax=Litoribacterium kuwaitense TaxID=1398745 RepID=UPI0013ED6F04|nr:HTH-type transcriptional regulator Hpr [Litoribacterium kuwaitense]NGP43905.1 HTH-type transcriptional regulator Hpr [Litoribacterium kuwaitense]